MAILTRSPLSHQSMAVYQLLTRGKALTAKDIARDLGILPNAVHRSAGVLVELGLIGRCDARPVRFQIRPQKEAIQSYLLVSVNTFMKNFSHKEKDGASSNGARANLSISFINTRSQLLEMTNNDTKTACKSINHLVSGLELPAETILSLKKAVDRGVRLRFLVQNLDELDHVMIYNWKRMGLDVRHFPLLEARIIVFDSKIVYLTSYNPRKKEEAMGVRFSYPPIGRQMNELFERRWKISRPIKPKDL